MRVVRRPKGSAPRRALTAASQIIEDPTQAFKTPMGAVGSRVDEWQIEAWEMHRLVPELSYYVSWRSGSCGRVMLIASELDDDGHPTGGIDEDNVEGQRVADIVRAIAGGRLGQSQYVKRSVVSLSVPGEYWTVILQRPDGPAAGTWLAVTREEIKRDTNGVSITLPSGEKHKFNTAKDAMFRVWNPGARKAYLATSPVEACLPPLREIVRTSRKIGAVDDSRLIGNGILFIPSEASLPQSQAPVSAGKTGDPIPDLPAPVAKQLQDMIVEVATVAHKDENSMAGLVPIVASAPGEHISKIQHIKFGDEITQVELDKRENAVARLARGLDVSPERLTGLASASNHWSMYAVGDEDIQLHIAPVMETICQAITVSILRTMLTREGIDPDKYVVWYDTSQLTTDPDKTDEAQEAWESGAINVAAYLELKGLPADAAYDLTTPDGIQQWALDTVSRNPALIATWAPLIAQLRGVTFPSATPAQPAIDQGDSGSEPDEEADPQKEPDTEDDSTDSGAAVDDDSRVNLAIDLLKARALELSGKRRRNTHDPAQVQRLRGISAQDTHRVMGPVDPAQIPRLIKGWDAGLDDLLMRYGLDSGRIRSAVMRSVKLELTREMIDV